MVTNLPPVEGREQLSAVTNLVMMSGSKRDDAFVHLRKIVRISEQQEETIRLAIKRTYENGKNNPYAKRKGRPSGQKNKPGHKAGRPPGSKKKQKQAAADSNSLPNMFTAFSGNTACNNVAEKATQRDN